MIDRKVLLESSRIPMKKKRNFITGYKSIPSGPNYMPFDKSRVCRSRVEKSGRSRVEESGRSRVEESGHSRVEEFISWV